MKRIPLTQGKFALVDDEDYDKVMQHKWRARMPHVSKPNDIYANTGQYRNGTHQHMHRLVMATPKGLYPDHLDGNGLNNCKDNLRNCTHRENLQNRHENATSAYPGVSWNKDKEKWHAAVRVNGKKRHLGYFDVELDAAIAYREACRDVA